MKEEIAFWGIVLLVAIVFFATGYLAGVAERSEQAGKQFKATAPMPGELWWSVKEKRLYIFDGEASEWIKLCEPCPVEATP